MVEWCLSGGHSAGSEDLHNRIDILATARLKKVGLQRARPGSERELAIITSQLRRRISAATVIASWTLMLEKMTGGRGGTKSKV